MYFVKKKFCLHCTYWILVSIRLYSHFLLCVYTTVHLWHQCSLFNPYRNTCTWWWSTLKVETWPLCWRMSAACLSRWQGTTLQRLCWHSSTSTAMESSTETSSLTSEWIKLLGVRGREGEERRGEGERGRVGERGRRKKERERGGREKKRERWWLFIRLPYSLLITSEGHIKLTDFGLSKIGLVNCKFLFNKIYYSGNFQNSYTCRFIFLLFVIHA